MNTYPKAGVIDDGASITNYYERRGNISTFASLAEYRDGTAIVGEPGSTEREWVTRVSSAFFATLGVNLVTGREFADADMTFEADHLAVVTDAYWRERLDGAPDALGRTIRVNGVAHVVIGVLPPTYRFLSSQAQLYLPLSSSPEQRGPDRRHNGSSTHMVARLTPGTTLAHAEAALAAHNTAVGAGDPQTDFMAAAGFRTAVVSLHDDHVASIRQPLLLVQAGAFLLLLIGAGNLVNLLLIHASSRAKEFAVRQALGAGRLRIALEVIVETTVLTVLGGLLGLVVGRVATGLLGTLGADHLPLGAHVALDARVAAFGLAGTLVLGIVMGLPLAWFCSRQRLAEGMRFESRGTTPHRAAQRVRHTFVVAQLALSFVLLSAAGLLAASLDKASAVSPGFRADHILSGQLSLPSQDYRSTSDILGLTDRLLLTLAQQPGVDAVGMATTIPLSGVNIKSSATAKGYVLQPGESPRGHYSDGVTGDYFRAMELPLLDGRYLTGDDPMRVAVVDEVFAKHYWPETRAVGQQIFQSSQEEPDEEAFTIVGVVGAVRQVDLTTAEALGAVYYPLGYRLTRDLYLAARTHVDPNSLASAVQRAVRQIDGDLPINNLLPMEQRVEDSLMPYRSPTLLAALFSVVAILLSAIGTYGGLSYAVGERRREIGLRIALGAQPGQIRRLFLSLTARLLVAGLLFGVTGAWLTGRVMLAILFDVQPFQTTIVLSTAVIIVGVSMAACVLPTMRATRMSPLAALAEPQ